MNQSRTSLLLGGAAVALLALLVYANALPNGLHVDDQQQIIDNIWIKDIDHLPEIFTSGVWEHAGRTSSYYRPFMYVLYMATYLIFGLQPWAFHLVNILIHVGCSVLVFLLARLALGNERVNEPTVDTAALLVGLLFAAHPIHTEAVAWAAGIADLSYSFFFLLALLLYLSRARLGVWAWAGSLVAFLVSLLCKEPALTLPIVLLAGDGLLSSGRPNWSGAVRRMIPYAGVTGLYLLLRINALGALAPVHTGVDLSASQYLINVVLLFSRYLEAMVFPVRLNFWHVFEPVATLVSWQGLRAFMVLGIFGTASWWALRRSKVALFGLILMVVPLLPSFHVSALNQGLENAFAERYLYLPSAGYLLFLGVLIVRAVVRWPVWRRATLSATVAMVVIFAVGTVLRNPVWKDAFTLWSDTVQKSPQSGVVQMNYGFALIHAGRTEEGREHLALARRLDPGRVEVKILNGIAYAQKGLFQQAVFELNAAVMLDPDNASAHYNLALVYEQMGWVDAAAQHYRRSIVLAPGNAQALNNLAILLAEGGDLERAAALLSRALEIAPTHPDYRANWQHLEGLRGSERSTDVSE